MLRKPLSLACFFVLTGLFAACSHDRVAMADKSADTPVAAVPPKLTINETGLPTAFSFQRADTSEIGACQDLNAHVNQTWSSANPVPADRTTWGSFEVLDERSYQIQKQIAEQLLARSDLNPIEKLVADFYATGMNEDAIESQGIKPLSTQLAAIDGIDSATSLLGFLRNAAAKGRGSVYGIGSESDFKDPNLTIAYVAPGGLGLPDSTYYSGDKNKAEREAYVSYIETILTLSGTDAASAKAQSAKVMALETEMAKVSYSREELSRDVSKYYNPMTISAADQQHPGLGLAELFTAAGADSGKQFSLANPAFFKRLTELSGSVSLADWKAYLRFHTLSDAAPYLSKALVDANFDFFAKTLRGQKEQRPRARRVMNALNAGVGEAMGQLYVQVAFPPEAKAMMQDLVKNLSTALNPDFPLGRIFRFEICWKLDLI